ncbi:MAG: tRNA (adenosine(37)-N6)-dimethylallyltransferase MiaA [Acidobacteriota bacterium]
MSPPDGALFPEGPLLAFVGPTATGKTRLAVEAALLLGGEIVSCDSMAVYKGFDIGTDKPSPAERRGVPHHLIDVAEPGSFYSAGSFRADALKALLDIWSRGRTAILVGGTGLYYRSLTRGLVSAPGRHGEIRERLSRRALARGPEGLHRILSRLDPDRAREVGPRDTLRIVRALEVRLLTGRPFSRWIRQDPAQKGVTPGLTVGLTAPKPFLYHRIERRVEEMMAAGLLDEVRRLREAGHLSGPASKAIGYGELASFLEGSLDLEEAVRRIKQRTRNLAKRQQAWFKKEEGIHWFDIQEEEWRDDALELIQRWREKAGAQP